MNFRQHLFSFDAVKAFQLAGILRQTASLLTGILLAKAGFSADQIGSYEYVLFFVTTASFFWLNGILQYHLSRHVEIETAHPERKVAQLLILAGIAAMMVVSVLHLFSLTTLQDYTIWMVALLLLLNVPSMFVEQVLFMRKDIRRLLVFSLVIFFLQLGLILLLVLLKSEFTGIYFILIFLAFIKFVVLLFITGAYVIEKNTFRQILKILTASLPFTGYFLVTGAAGIIDGWIIKFRWNDPGMFAVYKYGARDLPVFGSLAIGLGTALLPVVSKDLQSALSQLKSRSAYLMHIVYPVMILIVAFSDAIFPALFNQEFQETALVFSVYSFIVGSRFLYPQTILSGLGHNKFLFYNSIVELLINITLSILFSYYFGLAGIALGSVFAYFYEKIAAAIYLYKVQGIRLNEYTPLTIYWFYNSLLVLIFVISHQNLFAKLWF